MRGASSSVAIGSPWQSAAVLPRGRGGGRRSHGGEEAPWRPRRRKTRASSSSSRNASAYRSGPSSSSSSKSQRAESAHQRAGDIGGDVLLPAHDPPSWSAVGRSHDPRAPVLADATPGPRTEGSSARRPLPRCTPDEQLETRNDPFMSISYRSWALLARAGTSPAHGACPLPVERQSPDPMETHSGSPWNPPSRPERVGWGGD